MIITKEQLTNLISIHDLPHVDDSEGNIIEKLETNYAMKHALRCEYGIFGFPCREALIRLVEYIGDKPVLDMGAGTGYLSYGLKKIKPELQITAVDNYSTKFRFNMDDLAVSLEKFYQWYPIAPSIEIEKIQDHIVIINWPDLYSNWAYELTDALIQNNKIIFIGELNGCNANDKFFDSFELEWLDIKWFNWYGLYDQVYKIKRK